MNEEQATIELENELKRTRIWTDEEVQKMLDEEKILNEKQ